MTLAVTEKPHSKGMIWTGRILSTLITLFMLMDAIMKIVKPKFVIEGTMKMGYPENAITPIGLAALISVILYALPTTAILGAILLTGFLGGAVATHVRLGDGMWPFALVFGIVTWLGIYLRDPRVRAIVPLRSL